MIYLLYFIAVLIIGIIVFQLFRFIIRRKNLTQKIHQNYTEDLFWNCLIRWDWKKQGQNFILDKDNVACYCPNCQNPLKIQIQGGYYYLFCEACKFISTEFYHDTIGSESKPKEVLFQQLKNQIEATLNS